MSKILFIDHYDSFSFNLIDWLLTFRSDLAIERIPFDQLSPAHLGPQAERCPLVLSPGPHRPERLPATLELVAASLGKVPILAVCLGHQIVLHHLGFRAQRSAKPFHGSQRLVNISKSSKVFAPSATLQVATYNSLSMTMLTQYEQACTGFNEWGEVEFCEFWDFPFAALTCQFHPESFLSAGTEPLAAAFYREVDRFYEKQ